MVSESDIDQPWDSDAVTEGVRVRVRSFYVAERSNEAQDAYFFAYRVLISNQSEDEVQLESRHWLIVNGNDESQEVRGEGVVGQQPRLEPGDHFQYTSFCPLTTPVGTMQGHYVFCRHESERFKAQIAPFTLAVPNVLN